MKIYDGIVIKVASDKKNRGKGHIIFAFSEFSFSRSKDNVKLRGLYLRCFLIRESICEKFYSRKLSNDIIFDLHAESQASDPKL
jgi:hypothetical protein